MRRVRSATPADHDDIVRVAKLSKFTKGAASPHYLSELAYERRWVGVAVWREKQEHVLGFTVVRHCIRHPWTSLYYIGVDPKHQEAGAGTALVSWVFRRSPHRFIRLICEVENEQATGWYLRHGFIHSDDGANKSGVPYRVLTCAEEDFK